MSKIAVASSSETFERRIRRTVGATNGAVSMHSGEIASEQVKRLVIDLVRSTPDVVAIGPDVGLEPALSLAKALDEAHPEISVILVTEEEEDLWEVALRAGVRDVLAADTTDARLRTSIEGAAEVARLRRENISEFNERSGSAGRIITVVAPKGGSGKTALATNLGVGLAQADPGQVTLIDLDLMFGDVTTVLGLKPEHTLFDLKTATSSIDATMLKVFLTQRRGLHVLCAPTSPEEGEQVTDAQVRLAVDLLSREMSYIVIDTSAGLSELTIPAIEMSTDLVLMCDLSTAGVEALVKLVTALDRLKLTAARRYFVLNRADSKVGIRLADVAAAVGHPIDLKLPSNRSVPISMNGAEPLVESTPKSPFARQVRTLVDRFAGVPAKRHGLFRRRSRT